jgi:hypothetical protein
LLETQYCFFMNTTSQLEKTHENGCFENLEGWIWKKKKEKRKKTGCRRQTGY